MIKIGARLHIERILLCNLHAGAPEKRYLDKLTTYIDVLTTHPDKDVDPLIVHPSKAHLGMYAISNGHHRYVASIMVGRHDVLCVVVEEREEEHE